MLRPRIQAPIPLRPCSAIWLSIPVSPSGMPCIFRQARVWKNHSISSGPRAPRGLLRSWFGPAPKPSMEMAKDWTRSLGLMISNGFAPSSRASPASHRSPVDHAGTVSVRRMPSERVMRLADGRLIQDVRAFEEADGVVGAREPEASHIHVVHEFVAERGQHDSTGSPLLVDGGSCPQSYFRALRFVVAEEFVGQHSLARPMWSDSQDFEIRGRDFVIVR